MKHYVCKIAAAPTTLTAGTVYQAFINTGDKSLRVMKLHLQLDSADSGGGANSIYRFARIKGIPTGGTQLTATPYDTDYPVSDMLCLRNQAGLNITGIDISAYFLERSIVSKTTGNAHTVVFDGEEGFILKPNEGICIAADNNVISGSGVYGCIEWCEE